MEKKKPKIRISGSYKMSKSYKKKTEEIECRYWSICSDYSIIPPTRCLKCKHKKSAKKVRVNENSYFEKI